MNLPTIQIIDRLAGYFLIAVLKPIIGLVGIILRRDHNLTKNVRHIVVMKLLGGGSLFLAGPSLLAIRNKYPQAKISLISTDSVVKFAQLLPVFDRYLIVNSDSPWKLVVTSFRVLYYCWTNPVQILIDLELYSKLTGIFSVLTFAVNRIGFFLNEAYFRKGIYTHLIFLNQHRGIFHFYDSIAKLLGCFRIDLDDCRDKMTTLLRKNRRNRTDQLYCVVAPFCSEFGENRLWPFENWAQLISMLTESNAFNSIYIVGTANDKPEVEILLSSIVEKHRDRIRSVCGELSLLELCQFLEKCSLFIGIDSGPLHLARFYGKRVLSLWGATDPKTRLRPMSWLAESVIYAEMICSPCVHVAEESPCGVDNQCMKSIDVFRVYERAISTLEKSAGYFHCECIEKDDPGGSWTVLSRPFRP